MTQHKRLVFVLALLLCVGRISAQPIQADYLKRIPVRNIGPGAMSGRITAIASPVGQPQTIYAGAASGGVWRSKSGGTQWEPIFDDAPNQSVGSIAIQANNPDVIWVGTGEGNPRNSQNFGAGIFKSIDGGKKWTCMGLEKTRTLHRIVIHRDNPEVVFAASLGSAYGPTQERGVFKTSDGGKTWRKVLFVNDLTGCADLIADPRNPNKLYAAMWEYQRWPWFFKSGGKGSGLYVSLDGGETWERRNDKDGLPEGELGRIGLAVSAANPDIVYALVEAKDNALYRSTDAGKTWRQMATKNMGDRPFYYCEIHADPKNAHVLYSVHSQITRSIDGGRTFDNWVGFWDIHPDHHAFWINPENSEHIIDGNDGGLNITYDGGKTWRYAENIPVGQFYHVNVDNEMPYNVYGGLQDNGSWVGPSAVWKAGGIRNSDWQELYFGDGFDVSPRPSDVRYIYAMSQGGNLAYIDRKTGQTLEIQPAHPEHKNLRFNWNAAFAQGPFGDCDIYYGSQYLHYSRDCGQSWEIISPDLTTNDTSKMHQDRSGGLTLDATNAENHCTIMAIAPSTFDKNTIWVGTDDGCLQLTRDGGKTWTNLSRELPDFPKNGWIPQIELSAKNPGEAFVVVNNYRQNDWDAYLYHTTDFGKKWKRICSPKQVPTYCLSVVQDPETPNLLFLGTDQGLYFSIDSGDNWTKWPTESFPSVPVFDMRIQRRDGDLVLGTFGRAIWVLDDLRPLREMAAKGADFFKQDFRVLAAPDAVMAENRSFDGPRFAANATYAGDNKGPVARVGVWVKPGASQPADDKKKKDEKKEDKKDTKDGKSKEGKATVLILNMQGDTLRRFKTPLDTCFNYIYWGYDTKGVRMPSNNEPDKEQEPGGGPQVTTGTYKMVVFWKNFRDTTLIRVIRDKNLAGTDADLRAKAEAQRAFYNTIEKGAKAYDRLKEVERTMKLIEDQLSNVPDSLKKEVMKSAKALRDSISTYREVFFPQKEGKGIQRNPNNLRAYYYGALGNIASSSLGAPNQMTRIAIEKAEKETTAMVQRINALLDQPWKKYREQVEGVKYSLFKEFDKL
jgi:photosystem II stability/assembly factor-like uncharacterized protein